MASFKKRSVPAVRQNSRPKSSAEDEEEEDEPSVMNTMQDIKLGQKMRQKKLGAEFTSDGPVTGTGTDNKSKAKEKTEVAVSSSSIVSLGNTQFESRIDTGMTGVPAQNAAHEKIMEQYIAEQMGAKDSSSSSSSSSSSGIQKPTFTAEDELYRLPDEFKYVVPLQVGKEGGPPRSGVDDESAMVNMSVGIAEVALPIQFKLKNIEDTEMARRSLEDKRSARFRMKNGEPECIPTGSGAAKNAAEASARGVPDTVLATNRFWNARVHGTHQPSEKDKNDGKSSSSGDGTSDVIEKKNEFHRNERGGQGKHEFNKSGGGTGGGGGGGFRKRGNDDAVVQAFKKRQKYL